MLIQSKKALALLLPLLWVRIALAADGPPASIADADSTRQAFVAAMQRVRQNLPDTPDSPALEAYPIHAYLVAARLRRDLVKKPDEALDGAVDAFLQSHGGHPVTRSLRRDWLGSLAQRRRWDWFLPRSAGVADPALVCDRLEGRLVTGDTAGLAAAALPPRSLP